MSKKRSRDIGSEILEEIRQLKRGKICSLNHDLAAIGRISWPRNVAKPFPCNIGFNGVWYSLEASIGRERKKEA